MPKGPFGAPKEPKHLIVRVLGAYNGAQRPTLTVLGSQGVPKGFILTLRMPKTGPKASVLKGLGYDLCILMCFFEYVCVMFLLLQFSFAFFKL